MVESTYQTKTVRYARSKGFPAHRNYFGPGCEVGWPDVEIFLPAGRTLLIEFKVPGEEPKKIQAYRIRQLRELGHRVEKCYTFEEAKLIVDSLART